MSPVLTQHVSQPITLDEQTQKMKQHLLQDIRRSAYVYRVDCGGCNACEIEIFAAITPVFDAERFGIKVISSPRHADILLFTGAVTRAMRMPALRAYESAPDHKICVSYGACGAGGGFSTISTASGAAATPLSPLMFGSPAARQHRPPPFTVSPWRSVCCNRRFTRWIIAIPPGRPCNRCGRRSRHHSVSPLSEKRGGWRAIVRGEKFAIGSCAI